MMHTGIVLRFRKAVMQLRLIALVCAPAVTSIAGAQPVDSFEELQGLIDRGSDVAVTYGGRQIEGRVLGLSPSSLTLVSEGHLLELGAADVTRIRQRWHDPTRDCGLKGLAWVALPLGGWYLRIAEFEGELPAPGLLAVMGLSCVAGYVIGERIDARKTKLRDVYRRPATRVQVGPLLSRERLGAAVAVSW